MEVLGEEEEVLDIKEVEDEADLEGLEINIEGAEKDDGRDLDAPKEEEESDEQEIEAAITSGSEDKLLEAMRAQQKEELSGELNGEDEIEEEEDEKETDKESITDE